MREQEAKPQTFDSVTVYRPKGETSKEFGIALFDTQTILAGDAQSIFSSIERLRVPAGETRNDVLARAQSLDSQYDFWAVISGPGVLSSQRLPFAGFMQGLKELEIGISFTNGFSVNASIMAVNEGKAHALHDQLGKLLKLLANDREARPELALLVKKPKLGTQGSQVALCIRIEPGELDWGLRSLQSRRSAKLPVTAKPQRQTIRIDGLDEGPRDLVLVPNR